MRICFSAAMVLALLLRMAQAPAQEPKPAQPIVLPAKCVEHRFVVQPVTRDGLKLNLFTDSAGGLFLYEDAAKRFHLAAVAAPNTDPSEERFKIVTLPPFQSDAAIPSMILPLLPRNKAPDTAGIKILLTDSDGMLGQRWFAGRVWTFDYPGKRLLWRAANDLPPHKKTQEVALHFQTDALGRRKNNFARFPVIVDGESIDFLFDTGATNVLSPEALKAIGDGGAAERATSFLTRSQYTTWRKRHPEWRALDPIRTLSGNAMLEVPKITLGDCTIGPVWFTVQPDHAFHTYMAQWMDKPVEGAIGGSALKYLRVSVDWPNALSVFEPPQ